VAAQDPQPRTPPAATCRPASPATARRSST